jgi:hypothetical protein
MATWSVAVRFTRKGSTSTNQVTETVSANSEMEAKSVAESRVKGRSRDAENVQSTARKISD